MSEYVSGYEMQERKAAEARKRFGPAARDLAAYLRAVAPETASDFEMATEQWIRDHDGYAAAPPRA